MSQVEKIGQRWKCQMGRRLEMNGAHTCQEAIVPTLRFQFVE